MITIVNTTEEEFDLVSFLEKEEITLYFFAKLSQKPLSTLYSAKNHSTRRIKKEDFDQMMKAYNYNK